MGWWPAALRALTLALFRRAGEGTRCCGRGRFCDWGWGIQSRVLLVFASAASLLAAAPLSMLSLAISAASLKLWALPAASSATAALMATTL